jgi:sterol desaturase/sphingolipid hydroxylase (fatty acid hydroxylase superfamily)
MEKLVYYFEHIASWQRSLTIVLGIVFFWALEGIFPLIHFRYNKVRHAGLNLFFTATTVAVNLLFAYFIVLGSNYTNSHHIGLLHIAHLPLWLFMLSGLMILDFVSAWLIHWIQHQVKWMWKFHLIHHADVWVDTTTANRHHPMESIFRAIFTWLAVVIAGAPVWLLFMYQFLSVVSAQFIHANISLPAWLDKIVGWVIVTPDMHKVHHHYMQPLTDTNYGNIFSIWDRIFGTYSRVHDTRSLRYGIDTHMNEEEHDRIGKLLKSPFEEYHPPAGSKFSVGD